jgi:hypothetical protein
LHIEGLKLLLDDRANGVGGIVVPIVERLYQPIPRDQVDARMVEIGKMLEEVRTFVQQNPVSEAGMPVLKAALDRLASNEDMIQFADGYDSINGSDGIPACRKVTSQIEGLKLLLDAKASRVGDIVAPIIERLSQSIAEDQIDAQMVEIGMMLEGVKIAVQQNRVPEAGMPVLKAALDRLASTEEMIQFADGYDSINGSDDIPACRKVASQIEGLKLLLDAKANGVGDIVAPIIERLHQPIAQGQVDAQMGEIGTMLEGVRVAVQQNRVPVAGIPILRAALTRLAGNTDMIQWSNGNFSINECDNIPACRAVAMQIEELQILLDARANGQVNLEENIPPPMRELGKGCCNIVRLAHRGKGGQGPIALKPCDRAKSKRAKLDPDFAADFAKAERLPEDFLGTVSGSYRRNLAASGVQNIFVKIGALLGVEMPHVVANISAAEANGEACIAMEYLEGQTVGSVVDDEVRDKKRILIYDNEFIRHETWLQLMDILTGQVDRHGDNVMYTEDLPVGIDHDLSFPMNPPRNFAGSVPDRLGNGHDRAVDGAARRNYCMPPFIDGQMRDVIMALDLEELEAMYRECGLTRLELSAAMSRARALKSRVGALGQDQIIEPSAWEANEGRLGYDNSYAVRHYSGG